MICAHEVSAAVDGEADIVRLPCRTFRCVLARWHGRINHLEEMSLILLHWREVKGETSISADKSAMNIAMAGWYLAPFVFVDIRLVVRQVGEGRRCADLISAGASPVSGRAHGACNQDTSEKRPSI